MPAGAPKGNKNAEKWSEKQSLQTFEKAIELAAKETNYVVFGKKVIGYKYHFIGEVASELGLYRDLFLYLTNKFESCKTLSNMLLGRLESNCFSDSKKGCIKEATAIMNLKSNYKWTDRNDNTSGDEPINPVIINLGDGKKP